VVAASELKIDFYAKRRDSLVIHLSANVASRFAASASQDQNVVMARTIGTGLDKKPSARETAMPD